MAGAAGGSGARRRRGGRGADGGTVGERQDNAGASGDKREGEAGSAPAETSRAQALASATRTDEDRRAAWRETVRSFLLRAAVLTAFAIFNNSGSRETSNSTGTQEPASPPKPKEPSILSALMPVATGPVPAYYKRPLSNAWPPGTPCELRVFASENDALSLPDTFAKGLQPVWTASNLAFTSDSSNSRKANVTLPVPEAVSAKNSSWYIHAFLAVPDIWRAADEGVLADSSRENDVLYSRYNLVRWVKKQKEQKSLLGDNSDTVDEAKDVEESEDAASADTDTVDVEQMWKPFVQVQIVSDHNRAILSQMPENLASEYHVNKEQTAYYPPFFVNDFWIIRDVLRKMNDSVSEVTLEMSYNPLSLTKWSIMKSVEGMWETQRKLGSMRDGESDDLKRMFLDTSPLLLGTTMIVSVAHSILEVLAFRSDITHWKSKKSLEGVSIRSMTWNIAMQLIIFLYLWDNETSWLITIGNGIGILIEVWKLRKAVKVKSIGKKKLFGFIPWIELDQPDSYKDKTKEYDDEAMRYLSYIMFPCVIGYSIYTLRYEKHKSWYSWVIGSLVGAVYAFGFLMMLPQVIINYRLKSVAHMPMKAFAFKALNTIIDDLFSFIIKMPWLHRLACFRDDVVFLVFLYQMWIYPVDRKRVNEFGQRGDDDEPAEADSQTTQSGDEVKPKAAEEKKKD